jgi:monoamine oxidase
VILAGSDIANGWAGFIDGAIESGLRAGRLTVALSG